MTLYSLFWLWRPGVDQALNSQVVGGVPDRTYLDDAVKGGWATSGPRDRGIEIGHLDDVKATQLLFRVSVGAVQHLSLVIRHSYRRRRRGGMQTIADPQDARFRHGLHVRFIVAQPLSLFGLGQLGPPGLVHVVHQQISHGISVSRSCVGAALLQ